MAMDKSYAEGNGVTVTNTETSIAVDGGTTTGVPVARTDDGIYQLFLDGIANMVKGDQFRVKVYEMAIDVARVVFQCDLYGAQAEMFVMPPLRLGVGWDITLQRISASSRAFDWRISRIY
jgi:hypothetical protein